MRALWLLLLLWQPKIYFEGLARQPGRIDVRYQADVSPDQRERFEDSVGLPRQRDPFKHLTVDGKPAGAFFRYQVPYGHERHWLSILSDVQVVKKVEWPVFQSADSGHRTAYEADRVSRRSPGGMAAVRTSEKELHARIERFFTGRFSNRGRVRVLRRERNCLELQIDRVKSEVLPNTAYWERIQVYAVFLTDGPDLRLHLIWDGAYAPDAGGRPPAAERFSGMQRGYYRHLDEYSKRTLAELKAALEAAGG